MVTGQHMDYVGGTDHRPLPMATSERAYRGVHTPRKKPTGLDWAALTPRCRKCDRQSGQLDDENTCPGCRAYVVAKTPKPTPKQKPRRAAKPTTRVVKPRMQRERAPRPPAAPRPSRVNERAVIAEYNDGDTCAALAERHGITAQNIRKLLIRNGVQRRDDRATRSGGQNKAQDDPAFVEQVRAAYTEGLSQKAVAARLGVSPKVVWRVMGQHNIERRPSAAAESKAGIGHPSKIPFDQHEVICDRYRIGETGPAIAAAYSVSHAAIYYLLNKYDVPRHHTYKKREPQ